MLIRVALRSSHRDLLEPTTVALGEVTGYFRDWGKGWKRVFGLRRGALRLVLQVLKFVGWLRPLASPHHQPGDPRGRAVRCLS